MRETNKSFASCNSCKRLVPSRLHELHESKLSFVSRVEFIRYSLSNLSAHASGDSVNRGVRRGQCPTSPLLTRPDPLTWPRPITAW